MYGYVPSAEVPIDHAPVDAWKLGKNDLESMFIDYFRDESDVYEVQLETALATVQYEVSCKGFSPGVCEDEYLAQYYSQVRESENWTEAEVSDITYVYGYVPSAEVPIDHASEKRRKPEVILTVDHQGQMTPMAMGVMLVKDIA